MKFIPIALLLTILMCFAPGTANATLTSIETVSYGPSLTDWTQSFQFTKFDTSLGTLTGVELILGGSFTTTLTVVNDSSASSTGTVKTEMYMTVYDPGYFMNGVPNPPSPQAPLNAQLDFFSAAFGYSLGAGDSTSSGTLNSTSAGSTYDNWFYDANTLGEFTGPGNISLTGTTLTGTSLNNTGGNTTSTQVTKGSLSIGIRYQYTPSGDVPEPFTMALMGSGLALLGLVGRKRLTR